MFSWLTSLFRKPPSVPPGSVECWHASPEMPVEAMAELIQRSPPCLWTSASVPGYGLWHEWKNVQKAHRELMKRYCASLRPYPEKEFSGRGVVICCGGWRFFPSTFVTVRMLRHWGYKGGIELWYLGSLNEFDTKMEHLLRDYGPITWRDANADAESKGLEPRHLGSQADGYPPWEIKAYAVLHSAFAEVMSLDADSYPIAPFEFLWDHPKYLDSTALFWPDGHKMGNVQHGVWDVFGLPRINVQPFESGQLLINKRKAWKALNLTWWLNEHRDFTYRIPGLYGDKETFHVAWRFTKTPFEFPAKRPLTLRDMYLQLDFNGQPLFCHRTHNKWKLGGETGFKSGQGPTTRIDPKVPHEQMVAGWVKELDQLVNPAKRSHYRLRPGTSDEAMWEECVTRNDYQMPPRFEPGTIVLDIGANIGAFTHAALSRGAEFVYAVEPSPDNIPTMQRNLRQWRERVKLFYGAAWQSNKRERRLRITKLATHPNWQSATANWTVEGVEYEGDRTPGDVVSTIRFDTLVKYIWQRHQTPIVLKIDCEGGEFPILSTSHHLDKMSSIYGECHRANWNGKHWTQADIRSILESAGFSVRFADETSRNSLFWAQRTKEPQ